MTYLWLHIAKNEIRLWTNRFRKHRTLLFAIIIAIMGTYAFLLVPSVLNAFKPLIHSLVLNLGPTEALSLNILGFFMFFIFSFVILYVFVWCLTYPMSMLLQSTADLSGQLEILLKTPVKAHHILFGKFIGRLPIYLIILFALTPWLVQFFVIALAAFNITITVVTQIPIYLIFFVVIILGMWLGSLISAFVESKVRKSERSRDLGRALMFIVIIFTVAFMYLIMYIMFTGLADPTSPLFTIVQGFPSTWGVIIIMNIFGYPNVVPINVGVFIILLLGLTIAVLYLGYHGAARFYSLEPVSFETERITGEKRFYRFIRKVIPGDFGIQVVSQLKQFSRKLENFTRMVYAVVISAMMVIFNSVFSETGGIDIELLVMFTSFWYSLIISMMLGCYVIVGSKDNLWIYKKAPKGVKKFVWSVYLVHIIYTLPIGVIYASIIAIWQGITLVDGLLMVFFSITFLLTFMAIAIGLAFIFPTFEERGSKMGILMMSFMGLGMGIFIGAAVIGIFLIDIFGPFGWPFTALIFGVPAGYGLLRLGIRKLAALE